MRAEPFLTEANIEERLEKWLSMLKRSARPRPHLVMDPARCALIVVDMLRYFASPGSRAYLPSTIPVIPRIRRLLDLWRSTGGTVVFTRHCHEGTDDLGMLGRFFEDHIRCSEPDSEIVEDLNPREGEKVIRKNTYDAFHKTGLDSLLRSRGMKQVLVTGVMTQLCCETTARSAFVRGYEVYVPADALTTSSEELHIGSLRSLASGFAVITSTEAVCGDAG